MNQNLGRKKSIPKCLGAEICAQRSQIDNQDASAKRGKNHLDINSVGVATDCPVFRAVVQFGDRKSVTFIY